MENQDKLDIGNKLRELRIAHGYKQVEVAGIIDVKQPTYSQYESGVRTPGIITLYRLSSLYGLSMEDLLRMCLDLDDDLYFDAPTPRESYYDTDDYIRFTQQPKYIDLSASERELMYLFSKLESAEQDEVVDYTLFIRQRHSPRPHKAAQNHAQA